MKSLDFVDLGSCGGHYFKSHEVHVQKIKERLCDSYSVRVIDQRVGYNGRLCVDLSIVVKRKVSSSTVRSIMSVNTGDVAEQPKRKAQHFGKMICHMNAKLIPIKG